MTALQRARIERLVANIRTAVRNLESIIEDDSLPDSLGPDDSLPDALREESEYIEGLARSLRRESVNVAHTNNRRNR